MLIHKIVLLGIGAFLLVNCSAKNEQVPVKQESKEDSSIMSVITCPECGYKKNEEMPTDVCLIRYNCEKCNAEMLPKAGDCCVFCTYGTHKCPSMQ